MVEPSQFKDLFLSEAEDRLQKLNGNFLKLEKDPHNKGILKELIQLVHSLKSSCSIMGYKKTASLMHSLEDVFDRVRNGFLELSPDVIDGVFGVFDTLERSCKILKNSNEEPANEAGFILAEEKLKAAMAEGSQAGVDGFRAVSDEIWKEKDIIGQEVLTGSVREESSYVKVSTERLDTLMALAEELAVEKVRIDHLKKLHPETEELVNRLGTLITGIRSQIVQTRMVSIGRIFEPLPRLVRDLSRQQGKQIELSMSGSDLELDRAIIDQAAGPINHLLVNAVDHGIKKTGNIFIRAKKEGDRALIEVEDDGEGIDIEKVKEAAIKKKIISPERAGSFTRDRIIRLLSSFEISTSGTVGPISGRGIGLSSVRFFADKVGGRLSIKSPAPSGKGTLITLDLPLDLAIMSVLIIQVKNSFFGVPFSDIEKISTVEGGAAGGDPEGKSIAMREKAIPLIWLGKLFFPSNSMENGEGKPLVVVRSGKMAAGLVADDLIGRKEIIAAPFSSAIGGVKGFSGLTALGGGKSILILDTPEFLKTYAKMIA